MYLLKDVCRNARAYMERLVINKCHISVSAIILNSYCYQLNVLMKSFRLCAHAGKQRAASHSPFV